MSDVTWLDSAAAEALVRRYDVPMAAQQVVADVAGAVAAAREIGWPVALKAVAPDLVHRSDRGGVRLGLATAAAVEAAARELKARLPELTGYLAQAMAPAGVELLIGVKRDPVFGPVVIAGLGGVWAEVFDDVALRLAPTTLGEALGMLGELRGARLLDGYRGGPIVDRERLAATILNVSRLAATETDIVELDLNPVIAWAGGHVAVDARVARATSDALTGATGFGAGLATRDDSVVTAAAERRVVVERLLKPRVVAVVGATDDRRKQGGRLFHYFQKHGFPGALYAVNPRATEVMGRPCFPTVADVPETPDLVCVMVPAEAVPGVVADCGRRGAPAALVYTSGFAEAGESGQQLNAAMVAAARQGGVRLAGPNTAGIVNVAASTCAAFGMAFEVERMPRGDIAFLTQSGALGSSLLSRSWDQGVGFSHWVCSGNEADLTLADYLLALADDPAARVIAMFIESVKDPATFVAACRRAHANGKPIVVYKTGASEMGRRAVQSHTAMLAGDDRVYDAVFRQLGVVRVHDLQGLVDAALAFAWQSLPTGNRVAVVSASGGACSVIADECARHGLTLPLLPPATVERIKAIIPPFGAPQNPVDVTIQVTANPTMVGEVARVLLAEPEVDALIVLMTTNAGAPALEVAKGVVAAAQASTKPTLVVRVGAEFLAPEAAAYYRDHHLPLFPMPDRAVRVLRAMVDRNPGT